MSVSVRMDPAAGLKSILSLTAGLRFPWKTPAKKKEVTFNLGSQSLVSAPVPANLLRTAVVSPHPPLSKTRSTTSVSVSAEERACMIQMARIPQVVAFRRTRG